MADDELMVPRVARKGRHAGGAGAGGAHVMPRGVARKRGLEVSFDEKQRYAAAANGVTRTVWPGMNRHDASPRRTISLCCQRASGKSPSPSPSSFQQRKSKSTALPNIALGGASDKVLVGALDFQFLLLKR